MPWVRLDDQFSDHPKVLEVGPLGECLFVRGLTYASRYLTDGFVPLSHLRRMGDLDALAEAVKLAAAGLWEEVEGGYRIHDYLEYQPSAEKVKAERQANARRQADWRERKQAEAKPSRRDSRPRNAVTNDVTNDGVTPAPYPSPYPSRTPPQSPPVGDTPTPPARAREPAKYSQDFETFWRVYPRKVAKDAAWKAWQQRNGDLPEIDTLVAAVETQKTCDQWERDGGQYIPHPATWLNAGRWNDEPASAAAIPVKPGQRLTSEQIMARAGLFERPERRS